MDKPGFQPRLGVRSQVPALSVWRTWSSHLWLQFYFLENGHDGRIFVAATSNDVMYVKMLCKSLMRQQPVAAPYLFSFSPFFALPLFLNINCKSPHSKPEPGIRYKSETSQSFLFFPVVTSDTYIQRSRLFSVRAREVTISGFGNHTLSVASVSSSTAAQSSHNL